MLSKEHLELKFERQSVFARFIDPSGEIVEQPIEIRSNPITGRISRLAFSRIHFSSYLSHEETDGSRYIGATGSWLWISTFAPEGFFEIWGILPRRTSVLQPEAADWQDLAQGILNTQRFYRSLCRNGYNLGLLSVESPTSRLELRIILMVRSNYAPWVRTDHTGFEVMLGDMTTFIAPEQTAEWACPFYS